jgi:hypothetical protein
MICTTDEVSTMSRNDRSLSSRELLERIGLSDASPPDLLGEDPLDDLSGDIGAALVAHCRSFHARHCFAVGDLVTWKPGLRNRRLPRDGQPAVVMAVLETPITDGERESGSTYFNEPLDLVIGLFMESGPARGALLTWHVDGRRFRPWTTER